MPEEGIHYLPKKELLSFEEIERLIRVLAAMGITKIRLTGGEPFVRNDLMKLIRRIADISGIQELHITTNGVLTKQYIPELKKCGVKSVNLSLDTLDKERFRNITRRDEFEKVMDTFHALLENNIPLKINAVVMEGKNTDDIIPMVRLTEKLPVSVRFIEEMPFNGKGNHYPTLQWTYKKIEEHIRSHFPLMTKADDLPHSTASNFNIPGHQGTTGIIAAFSRTFCGTCNRLRVTAQGTLKTCLYDNGVLDIKSLLRSTQDDSLLREKLLSAFRSRAANGFEAEEHRINHIPVSESMSTIGG